MTDISVSVSQYNTPLRLSVPELKPKLAAHALIRRIARHYNVTIDALLGPIRGDADLVLKRHIAFYVVYKILRNGYSQTGRAFSKDHTTILHGIGKIDRMCKRDPGFKKKVWDLITMLRGNDDARDSMPVL